MKTITMMLLAAATAFAGDTSDDAARKLETKVSVAFRGTKMTDVLEVFRGATGLNFVAMDGAETSVTLTVRDVSAKSAQKLILAPAGLGAMFEHGAVIIRSRESMAGATTLRIYDIRSMMVKIADFPGPKAGFPQPAPTFMFGCFCFDYEIGACRVTEETLVDLLKVHAGGRSWDENPRVSLSLVSGLLYVTQTSRAHREIEDFLARFPS